MEYMIVILIAAVTAGMVSLVMGVIAYFLIKKLLTEEIENAASQQTAGSSDALTAPTEDEVNYIVNDREISAVTRAGTMLRMGVDSGAAVSVVPKSICSDYPLQPNAVN